jgi:hypothetical protein
MPPREVWTPAAVADNNNPVFWWFLAIKMCVSNFPNLLMHVCLCVIKRSPGILQIPSKITFSPSVFFWCALLPRVSKGKFAISWLSLCGGNMHTAWSLMQGPEQNFYDYCLAPRQPPRNTPHREMASAERWHQGRGQWFQELIAGCFFCSIVKNKYGEEK